MSRRKPADRRANWQTKDAGTLELVTDGRPVPPVPRRFLRVTDRAWSAFWQSELAGLVLPADHIALERLFSLYDDRERMERIFRLQPFVEGGATGRSVVAHPAAAQVASLDARITALEDRFGISPLARLKLGIVLGAAHKSLADINRGFEGDADADSDDEDDPRLSVIEGHVVGE